MATLVVGAASMVARPAVSCSWGDVCGVDSVDEYLPTEGAIIPANARGIFPKFKEPLEIDYPEDTVEPVLFRIEGGEEAETIPLDEFAQHPFVYRTFLFESPLKKEATYRLRASNSCDVVSQWPSRADAEVTFQTSASAPVPTRLGQMEIVSTKRRRIELDGHGECIKKVWVAQAEIMVNLDDDAKPWKDLIWYQTFVNGEGWGANAYPFQFLDLAPGSSWVGRGNDLIFAGCSGNDGLEEGLHVVEIRGYLPGVDEPILSDQIEVDLTCGAVGGCGGCAAANSGSPGRGGFFLSLILIAAAVIRGTIRVVDPLTLE